MRELRHTFRYKWAY